MNPESNAYKTAAVVDEISKWTVGLGIVTIALFTLSLPILILTAAALLPLLIPLLALGLVAGVVALPIVLVRRLVRRRRPPRSGEEGHQDQVRSPTLAYETRR
jgi:membrane protein implicated in regulation of membrane protease activity